MVRLRPTFGLAVLAAGCTGQNVQGRWTGRFPLAGAHECETRLLGNGAATVACDGTAIVGAGRYRWDGVRLTISLSVLAYDAHRVRPPEPFTFAVQGEGNAMRATYGEEVYEWRRTMR